MKVIAIAKSKRRRGEDDHDAQFGRCTGCCGQERAADRSGQSGQPDDQCRHGAAGGSEDDCRRSEERRRADPASAYRKINDRLHIVTSIIDLARWRWNARGRAGRKSSTGRWKPIKDSYDYILIDCPPQLSILNQCAFLRGRRRSDSCQDRLPGIPWPDAAAGQHPGDPGVD